MIYLIYMGFAVWMVSGWFMSELEPSCGVAWCFWWSSAAQPSINTYERPVVWSTVNVTKAFRKQHHFSFSAPPSMYKMSETLTSHGGWVPVSGSPAQWRINSEYPSSILEQISHHVLCLYLFSVSCDHLESRTIFPYHRSQTHLKKTFCRISFQNNHLWKSSGLKQYGGAVKIHKK